MNIQEASNILSLILILYSSVVFYYNFEEQEAYEKTFASFDERMKYYEEQSKNIIKIQPYQPFIVRIDGWNFKSLTSKFKKPFDEQFMLAITQTANDLLNKFNPSTVFVQSDEITLVFPAICSKNNYRHISSHIFGGDVHKLTTIISGYASSVLSSYLKLYFNEIHHVSFDGRIAVYPENAEHEILNNLIWRSSFNGYRNYVSMNAYYHLQQKDVEKMTTEQRINALREIGINIENNPVSHFYGTIIKKVKTNENRITNYGHTFKINFSQELYNKIMKKYLNHDEILSPNQEVIEL